MHIAFRVEGNSHIGLGHLMRCMALAQHCVDICKKISFLVTESTYEQVAKRQDWVGQLIVITRDSKESDTISHFCCENDVDFLIIDGYQFGACFRQALFKQITQSPCETQIIAIDDNNDMGSLYAHGIVNGNSHASRLNYHNQSPAALFLGEQFRILRKEFDLSEAQFEQACSLTGRDALTIILGGADSKNLSLLLAKALVKHLPDVSDRKVPINVITGSAYLCKTALDDFSASSPHVEHWHNVQNVSSLFLRSRLVVTAGGSTQYELQALCTPSLLLVVADNQCQASMQSAEEGKARVINVLDKVDLSRIVDEIVTLWQTKEALEKMQSAMKIQAKTNGADNLLSALVKLKEVSENRRNDYL